MCGVYYIGVNALLATPWPQRFLNERPELAQVHYDRAWTLFPLRFEVRGLRVSTQDQLAQVEITAESARGSLRPWALRELRFVARELEAEGVTFKLRPRDRKSSAGLAPITAFDEAPLPPPRAGEAPPPLFSLELGELVAHHVREVWIDRLRYTGDAEVEGGLRYRPFRALALEDVRFKDTAATLVAADEQTAQLDWLDVRVDLKELDLTRFEFADLSSLNARVALSGQTDPGFVNAYLHDIAGVPGLRLEGEPGRLALELEVKDGRVEDGARLSYRSPRAGAHLPWFTAQGDLELIGASARGRLSADVSMSRAVIERGALQVRTDRVTIAASSDSDLRSLPFVDALVTVVDARVPELRALDELLPAGPALRIAGGRGRIDATLWATSSPPGVRGDVRVRAEQISLRNRGATIEGRLELRARVRALDLTTGALDLSGTTLRIDRATVRAGAASWPGQWLHLQLTNSVMNPRGPMLWRSEVDVAAADLQPLFALFAANVDIPRALGLFTASPDPHLVTRVEVRTDGVNIPSLRLTSKNVGLDAVVALKPMRAAPEQLGLYGWAVVRLGAIELGFELDGPTVTLSDPKRLSSRAARQ